MYYAEELNINSHHAGEYFPLFASDSMKEELRLLPTVCPASAVDEDLGWGAPVRTWQVGTQC